MPKPSPYLEAFEERWLRYRGEKDGKKLARGYWNAGIKTEDDIRLYDQAEANYYAFVEADWKRGFQRQYKGGKTWFNNWRDYVDQEPVNGNGQHRVDTLYQRICDLFVSMDEGELNGQQVRDEANMIIEQENGNLRRHHWDTLNYILEKLETNNG